MERRGTQIERDFRRSEAMTLSREEQEALIAGGFATRCSECGGRPPEGGSTIPADVLHVAPGVAPADCPACHGLGVLPTPLTRGLRALLTRP
jgi:hypothetical protein